ncbi:MAG TPA: toprim domain-containing protein, partial [Ktedonobacteraceae bacterium]|nr:toprim domain-containing protein [Ktedonobacteraceae bacterium]
MKPDFRAYSSPVLSPTRGHQTINQPEQDEAKQVDYSHLDIVAEVERIIGRSLRRHTRSSGKYHCACPFPDCTSKHDAFTVWERPILEERSDGRQEVHFWCGRCGRTGSLISLVRQYRQATTGEVLSWAEAARELRIDPQTWHALEQGQTEQRTSSKQKRQREAEQQHQREQAELDLLDAVYPLACKVLATGQLSRKEGEPVPLEQMRAYLARRGFTLEQAAALGMGYIPTRQEGNAQGDQLSSWRGRIVFPLHGPKGTRGYAGRTLFLWKPGMEPDAHKARLDSWNERRPTQHIARYYKTQAAAFYGYEQLCQASKAIIVEGEFDAASVRLALKENPDTAVCAMGKHFQARLLPLNVLSVVLALDRDQAGQEMIQRQKEELEGRGISVEVAQPPVGKDWNDCHVQAGLATIRKALAALCPMPIRHDEQQTRQGKAIYLCACSSPSFLITEANQGYCKACWRALGHEPEYPCVVCGNFMDTETPGGSLCCFECFEQAVAREQQSTQLEKQDRVGQRVFIEQIRKVFSAEVWPEGYTIEEEHFEDLDQRNEEETGDDRKENFTVANYRCPKHGRRVLYSDELGGRYCDQVECWERYRFMRIGAKRVYPTLIGVIDPRDYLADTNTAPLSFTASGLPIYPVRPI